MFEITSQLKKCFYTSWTNSDEPNVQRRKNAVSSPIYWLFLVQNSCDFAKISSHCMFSLHEKTVTLLCAGGCNATCEALHSGTAIFSMVPAGFVKSNTGSRVQVLWPPWSCQKVQGNGVQNLVTRKTARNLMMSRSKAQRWGRRVSVTKKVLLLDNASKFSYSENSRLLAAT